VSAAPRRPLSTGRIAGIRAALVAAVVVLLEAGARGGLIDPLLLPPPSQVVARLPELVPSGQFLTDLRTTATTVVAGFALGASAGLLLGVGFARFPFAGAVFEPYLVSLYSMPTLVFYPVLLAVLGLGTAPIIVIAATMALIPVALNTMVALRSIPPTLPKLARSLSCTTAQRYLKVLAPAATPLVVPGLVLGFIYAVIGTIAMEFILAPAGIGFRIGFTYNSFEIVDMYAHILVVSALAIAVNVGLNALERRVRRDMR
jgi:NitT/TauT family transport system permease protein